MSFLDFLKKESDMTVIENDAVTYRSTNSHCLDLFYRAGALRGVCEDEINKIVERAYVEDAQAAMKKIFSPAISAAALAKDGCSERQ